MSKATSTKNQENRTLPKAPTGIQGLDEITAGGFPRGRPTLICGSAGAGKTLLAMEFLVRGATQYNEPGVFMAFEETAPELTQNVRSLGFDWMNSQNRKSWPSILFALSAARLTKPATMISKAYLSGWALPSTGSAPSVSSWTPSRIFSRDCRMKESSAPNCGASFAGSKTGA